MSDKLNGQQKGKEVSDEIKSLISEAIENKKSPEQTDNRTHTNQVDIKFSKSEEKKAVSNTLSMKKSDLQAAKAADKTASEKNTAAKKHKKGWSTKKKTGVTLGIIFLLLVIIMAVIVGLFFHYTGMLDRDKDTKINKEPPPINESDIVDKDDTFDEKKKEEELKAQLKANSTKISDENVMNILIIGEDIRDTEGNDRGNTDVMMVISINHENKTITMTSLMRDMYVYMSEYNNSGRLNAAYWHGGAEYLEEVIEDYFGIEIDRYVKVNFRQFIDIVEAVGGLDLTVAGNEAEAMDAPLSEQNKYLKYDKGTDYIDKSLYSSEDQKIEMHLNGNQSLAYARIRYNCGDDYGRTQRQRIVIKEIISKAKHLSFLELDKLIKKVFPEVQTDITDGEIASLLLNAFDYMEYDIQELRIPADGYYTDEVIYSMQVLSPNYQANGAFMKYMIYGDCTNIEEAAAQYESEIADGTFYEKNNIEPDYGYYW